MNIFLLISLILTALSGLFALTRQLQMLQQNSYFPSRYYKWVKSSYTISLALCCIGFCASSFLYMRELYILQTAICAILLIIRLPLCISQQKKSIKKLVFTARIKRLFIAAAVVFAALIAVYCITPTTLLGEICTVLCLGLGFISPLICLISWALTYPIEKAVSRWYVNDAKRILKEHKSLTVIGVTGSYGKTTTKFILNRILSEKFNTVCTPQSFNTPMGVVRTVRGDIKPQTQIFICEMGAKNIGDIKEICDIAHPKYGIITSVGPQHLDTFKTVDNVFKTKFELASEVRKNGGITFVNADSCELIKRADTTDKSLVTFGGNTDYRAESITYGAGGSTFDLVFKDERISVTTKLLGLHSIADIVAAAALAHTLGVTPQEIKFAVSSLKPTEHRLELKAFKGGSLLIDDAYNSNPEGCLEAVRVLGSFEGMRKVIITPGLIELGDKEYDCNFALGLEAAKYCDIIILVGKNRAKPMLDALSSVDFDKEKVFVVSSFAEAMSIYAPTADKNSVVLLENDLPDNYLN